jgi:hypothetical protein
MVNFPASLDSLANPTSTTETDDPGFELDVVVSTIHDILEAVEAKLGTGADVAAANEVLVGSGAGATHFRQILAADITAGAVMKPLYDTALGVAAASIDVQSISQAYRSFIIQIVGRGDTAATQISVSARFNADSGTNYDYQNLHVHRQSAGRVGNGRCLRSDRNAHRGLHRHHLP